MANAGEKGGSDLREGGRTSFLLVHPLISILLCKFVTWFCENAEQFPGIINNWHEIRLLHLLVTVCWHLQHKKKSLFALFLLSSMSNGPQQGQPLVTVGLVPLRTPSERINQNLVCDYPGIKTASKPALLEWSLLDIWFIVEVIIQNNCYRINQYFWDTGWEFGEPGVRLPEWGQWGAFQESTED